MAFLPQAFLTPESSLRGSATLTTEASLRDPSPDWGTSSTPLADATADSTLVTADSSLLTADQS